MMDALRNQIIERKVIQTIMDQAEFKEVDYQPEEKETTAVDHAIGGIKESIIPVAKHGGDAEQLKQPADRV
jgi:hypothetical protein